MDVRDVYGAMPDRPDSSDFWRLVEIINEYDVRMDAAVSAAAKTQVFDKTIEHQVDPKALAYMALQRAMRGCGIVNKIDLMVQRKEVTLVTAAYMEAFLVGCAFVQRGGHRE